MAQTTMFPSLAMLSRPWFRLHYQLAVISQAVKIDGRDALTGNAPRDVAQPAEVPYEN